MTKTVLSLDAILFTVLTMQYVVISSLTVPNAIFITAAILCVLLYLLVDFYAQIKLTSYSYKLKTIFFLLVVFLLIYLPTLKLIQLKYAGQSQILEADGAIMTEEAAKELLEFKNPYTISYKDILKDWPYKVAGITENPTLEYFPYLPAIVIINSIGYLVTYPLLGFFDTRIISLIVLSGSIFLIFKNTKKAQNKLLFATLFLFNPIFITSFLWGQNDIYLLFFILAAAYSLKTKRVSLALLMLTIACTIKQFAWILVPFMLFYVLNLKKGRLSKKIRFVFNSSKLALIYLVLFTLPFIIAGPGDFVKDILFPASGTVLGGYGLAGLLYSLKIIQDRTIEFPFLTIQLLLSIPIFFLLLKIQKRNNTLQQVFFNYSVLLLIILYFGRFVNHNYLAYFSELAIITFFLKGQEK